MKKNNILLAFEDQELLSKLQHRLISDQSDVRIATDGITALNDARVYPTDIFVVSDSLFKLNGYKISRLLKKDSQFQNISIIILMTQLGKPDLDLIAYVSADDYILKPYNLDGIVQKINSLLKV